MTFALRTPASAKRGSSSVYLNCIASVSGFVNQIPNFLLAAPFAAAPGSIVTDASSSAVWLEEFSAGRNRRCSQHSASTARSFASSAPGESSPATSGTGPDERAIQPRAAARINPSPPAATPIPSQSPSPPLAPFPQGARGS